MFVPVRILRCVSIAAVPATALLLAACVGGGPSAGGPTESQPRFATYRCGEAGTLTVENRATQVHVVSPRGVEVDLPASPPSQRTRYGGPMHALVLEGRNALWMANGKEPLDCRR